MLIAFAHQLPLSWNDCSSPNTLYDLQAIEFEQRAVLPSSPQGSPNGCTGRPVPTVRRLTHELDGQPSATGQRDKPGALLNEMCEKCGLEQAVDERREG